MKNDPTSGISGALGGIKDIKQLVRLLGAYFLPTSLYAPPAAMSSSGGRSIAVGTNSTGYVRSLDGKTGNVQIKVTGIATIDDSVDGVITINVPAPTIRPSYAASGALVAGAITFNIPAGTFTNTPAVAVTAGVSSSATLSWTRTNTQVVVTSSSGTDTRTVDLLCLGNPHVIRLPRSTVPR